MKNRMAERKSRKQPYTEAEEDAERAELEALFGPGDFDDCRIIPAEEILSFDKYFDYQEGLLYVFLLHIMRIIMLVKLVNKSQNLKFQERIKKQHRAESHSQNA